MAWLRQPDRTVTDRYPRRHDFEDPAVNARALGVATASQ